MVEHFDTEELEDMCFDLGIPYDSLSGIGKRAKARSLIAYFEKRIEMYKLFDILEERRPHVDWPIDIA